MFVVFFLFLCIPVVLIVMWGIGRWVLGPFTEAVRLLSAPTRFFLSDFIWLLVLLQASFAIARLTLDQQGSFLIILIFLVVASTAIWAGAVSVLSRAGVQQTVRRGLFTLVLLPALLLLMAATVFDVSALIVLLAHVVNATWPPGGEFKTGLWFLLGIPAIIATAWALRRLTRWIVAGVPPPDVADMDKGIRDSGGRSSR